MLLFLVAAAKLGVKGNLDMTPVICLSVCLFDWHHRKVQFNFWQFFFLVVVGGDGVGRSSFLSGDCKSSSAEPHKVYNSIVPSSVPP